jgi:3-oxoacyl-[acyl-carrier protein] reductase
MLDIKGGEVVDKLAAEVPSGAGRLRFIACDLADPAAAKALVQELDEEAGGIDILVNNAAINPMKPIDGYDLAEWQKTQDVNATSAVALAQAVVPSMKKKGWGQIVQICSVTLNGGWTDFTAYVSSKGTLLAFTRSLARELGQFNIRVNAVSPGAIPTPLEKEVWADQLETYEKFLLDHQALKYRGARGHRRGHHVPGLRPGPLHHRPEHRGRRRLVDAASAPRGSARSRASRSSAWRTTSVTVQCLRLARSRASSAT